MSEVTFWDRQARSYFRRPIADVAAYEATLTGIRGYLLPTHRVLELGCGTGGTAVLLARHVAEWTGTDVSPEMIRCAHERLAGEEAPQNVELRVASIDHAASDRTHDVVCAFNLLHLVRDLDQAVRSMHAALRPNGLAISKTPCLAERGILLRGVLPLLRALGRAPRVQLFDTSKLEAAFVRGGFELVESRTFGAARTSRFLVARALPDPPL